MAKPAYTTAYTSQPIVITARRPILSDQLPPTIDTVAFTTCSAAHIRGTKRTVPATSVNFSRRNASVEFPSVKSVRTSMKRVKDGGSGDVAAVPVAAASPVVSGWFDTTGYTTLQLAYVFTNSTGSTTLTVEGSFDGSTQDTDMAYAALAASPPSAVPAWKTTDSAVASGRPVMRSPLRGASG